MSTRLLRNSLTAMVLLLAGGLVALAKPPDLPDDPNVDVNACREAVSECSDTAPQEQSDDVCVQEETEEEPPTVEVIGVMPQETELLEVMPQENEPAQVSPGKTGSGDSSPAGCVCPYLKQQAAQKQAACSPPVDLQNSVLDQLKKLKQADKLFQKAEHLQKAGKIDRASAVYKQIQELCPGSRLDVMAATKLQQIVAQQKPNPEVVSSEEQETYPVPQNDPRIRQMNVEARVEKLLQACQQAFKEGDYSTAEKFALKAALRMHNLQSQSMTIVVPPCSDEKEDVSTECEPVPQQPNTCAVPGVQQEVESLLESSYRAAFAGCLAEALDLAEQAYALDPTSLTASFLVCKLRRQLQLNEDQTPEDEDPANAEQLPPPHSDEPQSDGNPNDNAPESDAALRPELPAVDPKVVDALERVLAQSGEPISSKLVIIADEPVANGEQVEEPISQWPYLSTDVQMPSLFVPMLNPQSLQEDEDDGGEEENPMDDDLSPVSSLNEMLRDAVEVLQQGGCIEVDDSKHGCLRFRCQSQVGCIECQLFQDDTGHGYMTLKLTDVPGDLRAAQRKHNQQVIDWIDEVGGVEPTATQEERVPDENLPEEEDDEVQTN